ncbi:MAG: UvrD-helicase domain-containing protein, partial [Candidatus Nomurabacteria bacterium]|nr:UvrD-helicase domain-containing protein [Candidatus Nomurabacteria bacterium]
MSKIGSENFTRDQLAQNFQREYAKLNDAQRAAVDAVDGPVLVVAGPGTGKTQLLSVRVAQILRQTDADPGNILCLTFTRAGADN